VNPYPIHSTYWEKRRMSASTDLWSAVATFVRHQPEMVVTAALAGGVLLGLWHRKSNGASDSTTYRAKMQRRANVNEIPNRMPSARLGATEDQIEELAGPSPEALEAGTAGVTGAAYDLDPRSITAG
jgi:hypothetical protein